MGFIGKQPTPVPLTSSDITDGIVTTAKIADDAVGNTKLDLSANYAFTGTITGAGKILQAVQFRSTTYQATTSTSYVNYSHSNATITPSSTSNKVLVLSSHNTETYQNNSYSAQARFQIYRGGSALSEENYIRHYDYGASGHLGVTNFVINFLDSPSSTSSVSYEMYMKLVDGDGTAIVSGSITLLEVLA